MSEENVQSIAQAVIEVADALLARWGQNDTGQLNVVRVRTGVGDIHKQWIQGRQIYRIGPKFHNWSGEYTTIEGDSITGNIFYAAEIVARVAEFLATDDWLNKVSGSIRMLKRIHRAIIEDLPSKQE